MFLDKLNYPWLRYRWKIILSFLIDSLFYLILFRNILLIEKGINLEIKIIIFSALFLWTSLSYIFGRYNFLNKSLLKSAFIQVILTTICLAFFSILINLSSNLLEVQLIKSYTKNLLFFSLTCFISSNLLINYHKKSFLLNNKFIFIGEEKKAKLLISEIKNQNINYQINLKDKINNNISKKIKGIIIDNPSRMPIDTKEKLLYFQRKGIEVRTSLSWCENYLQSIPSYLITNSDLITGIFKTEFHSIEMRLKRLGDIFFSMILLFMTMPIILISILLIYLEDRGQIFYFQERVGKDEKIFKVIKLRSMKTNAEINGPQWAQKNDSRVTRVGKYLRKTRIDELPQLISVIKGEMSLIGPRPERFLIDKELKKNIPYYSYRYSLRPGLSGWAQVNYPYGASIKDSKNKLSYDLFYIKNRSFILDILILLKTIKLILNAGGANPKA